MEDQRKSSKGVIYFDGLCRLCSAEINHYAKLPGAENFYFVDITQPDFNAHEHGLNPYKVHKVMHVRDENGKLHEGVDAFRVIWQKIPRYHFMDRLSKSPLVRPLMNAGYKLFVIVRPYLPRKKADCSASPYCEVPK